MVHQFKLQNFNSKSLHLKHSRTSEIKESGRPDVCRQPEQVPPSTSASASFLLCSHHAIIDGKLIWIFILRWVLMTFYGVPEEDKFRLTELSNEIVGIYKKNNRSAVQADNMLLALRKMSFMEETEFSAAIRQYCFEPDGHVVIDNMTKFWRLHVYTWCCSQALRQKGRLVECGVHRGLYCLVMATTLECIKCERKM